MLNRILNKGAGSLVGLVVGLFCGPVSAVGKYFAIINEDAVHWDLDHPDDDDDFGYRPHPHLEQICFAFIVGIIYGPIRGFILGMQYGLSRNIIREINQELFSYNYCYTANLTPEIAERISANTTLTYKKFHQAEILTQSPREPLIIADKLMDDSTYEFSPKQGYNPSHFVNRPKCNVMPIADRQDVLTNRALSIYERL
jgi:hypothetical protein